MQANGFAASAAGIDFAAVLNDVVKQLVELIMRQTQIAANFWQIADVFVGAVTHPLKGVINEIQIELAWLVKILAFVFKHKLLAIGDGFAAAQMHVEIGNVFEHVGFARCRDMKFQAEILLVRVKIQLWDQCDQRRGIFAAAGG